MKKVGLYFGSFNPVHIGHMAIAGYMTGFTDLDQVWFVVSPQNPFKSRDSLLPDYQRLYMTQLAIGDNDRLRASDIEFRLPVPSYTIDTLSYLSEKHNDITFCLLMGEDNLYTLHKWKNCEELVKRYPVYVYPRPGCLKPSSVTLDQLLSMAEIHYTKAPLMEISGTFVREGIRMKKDMSYFVPPAVWKYIVEMHFYEKKESEPGR